MTSKAKPQTQNAISLLKSDHDKVKELFDKFEKAGKAKGKIVSEAIHELKIHATIEEALFYPALRQIMDDKEGLLEEADEEHHVVKVLIAELEKMTGHEDHWEAKFSVLSENVRHHIKEEEGEMFPKARKTNIDFQALGERMVEMKARLKKDGVPPDAESKMVEKSGLRGDSPAKKAHESIQVPLKS